MLFIMEKCVRCDIDGERVRLFDAIYLGKVEKICERCSIIENIPLIKRPDALKLKESERGRVYDRMRRLSGMEEQHKREDGLFRGDRLRQLDTKPELEIPEKNKLNLIDHFDWEIMRNRRRKGLSHEQLAQALGGESAIAIAMIEKGKVPENAENLIKKLEQFFQIRLRNLREVDRFMLEKERAKKPVLLDREGRELKRIPESEPEVIESDIEVNEEESKEILDLRGIDKEKSEFDIKRANLSQVRIGDLKDLHRKKIESTKKEREEEKIKLSEKQKLVEARKEELRFMRERDSRELDSRLGGAELLKKNEGDLELEEMDEEEEDKYS